MIQWLGKAKKCEPICCPRRHCSEGRDMADVCWHDGTLAKTNLLSPEDYNFTSQTYQL